MYITKTKFFIAFQAVYNKTIISKNIKAEFCRAGLVSFDLQAVISKLDIKLQTPTSTRPPPAKADSWVSKTLYNSTETLSQTKFIKNKIVYHQGSLSTSILNAST
jgi:hypothetical protein